MDAQRKLIGTFLLPGGLAFPAWLALFAAPGAAAEVCAGSPFRPGGHNMPPPNACSAEYVYGHPIIGYFVLALAIVIPIAVVIYLARRARRAAAAS